MFDWMLAGGIPTPLKVWVRQLGWLFPTEWKKSKPCSKPPTRWCLVLHLYFSVSDPVNIPCEEHLGTLCFGQLCVEETRQHIEGGSGKDSWFKEQNDAKTGAWRTYHQGLSNCSAQLEQDAPHESDCLHVEHFCEKNSLNSLVQFSPFTVPVHYRLWNIEKGRVQSEECRV